MAALENVGRRVRVEPRTSRIGLLAAELTHIFPVSVGDAFAYIIDTESWKEFVQNFGRLHDPTHAKWKSPAMR